MKITIHLFAVALLSACAHEHLDRVTLRMEVAYSVLGNMDGGSRIWPVLRVPGGRLLGAEIGAHFLGSISCKHRICTFGRVVSNGTHPSNSPTIGIDWVSNKDGDAILLLEPFPIHVSAEEHRQLQYQEASTSLVDVDYSIVNDKFVFHELRFIGSKPEPPVVWK